MLLTVEARTRSVADSRGYLYHSSRFNDLVDVMEFAAHSLGSVSGAWSLSENEVVHKLHNGKGVHTFLRTREGDVIVRFQGDVNAFVTEWEPLAFSLHLKRFPEPDGDDYQIVLRGVIYADPGPFYFTRRLKIAEFEIPGVRVHTDEPLKLFDVMEVHGEYPEDEERLIQRLVEEGKVVYPKEEFDRFIEALVNMEDDALVSWATQMLRHIYSALPAKQATAFAVDVVHFLDDPLGYYKVLSPGEFQKLHCDILMDAYFGNPAMNIVDAVQHITERGLVRAYLWYTGALRMVARSMGGQEFSQRIAEKVKAYIQNLGILPRG